ncbi:MAG: aspartoacylase [Cyanobacteriota bacterium]|nr:aspartoacylase [Cyanobacteriota bacterium]
MTGEPAGQARVLVVGGTHGNERNGVQLLRLWSQAPHTLRHQGLAVELVEGNPTAISVGRRYVDRDLNRSFQPHLLDAPSHQELEARRARELVATWGPRGATPCAVALDLHSTTAAMGNSLVVYGRRPADLALAAGLQGRLGLPVYLHEGDPSQRGYLVEQWPCGLVIEVGPVPQGVVNAAICRQTQLALETALAVLAEARSGRPRLPERLVVHRHLRSLDLPRDGQGLARALVHPQRQGRDWWPLRGGDPLFQTFAGAIIPWAPAPGDPATVWPVFINEAAYEEKGIALSLTEREVLPAAAAWGEALARTALTLKAAQPQT